MIELNGYDLWSIQDVHREFARQADLPPFYGANLSALWDALTGMVERPLTIRWLNADESFRRFPQEMAAFEQVIEAVRQEDPWPELIYERVGGSP
ncbi:barstar family protein [Deinococcus sp. YIM 134068]|uniref:barstar family protein n=1 Tax=Deinococcus lichenicola TaxID=3118910 RepID=UPI002F94962F